MTDLIEDSRRRFLVHALSTGLLVGGSGWTLAALAQSNDEPLFIPSARSIFRIRGRVLVNGQAPRWGIRLQPTDIVETGADSHVAFVVGDAAFLLREDSKLVMSGRDGLVRGLKLLTGKLLNVFGKRDTDSEIHIETPVATIGIRGTGIYLESETARTYACTCYGRTVLASARDPMQFEEVQTTHHDSPRYILAQPENGRWIVPAKVSNHSDEELILLESLVGRKAPMAGPTQEWERY
jgi:hypothetical protein